MKTMKHVLCWMLVAAMVIGMMPAAVFATESNVVGGREVVSLSSEWQFTEDGKTTTVTVPHCWGHGGDASAKVTKTCTYEKEIDVSAYEGKELFLYFEAVNKTAKVYVDGELLATHVGGFYSFAVDITDACAGKDTVTVKVEATNNNSETVPLYSDFTYFGGIYRDAWLIAVNPAGYISNEDYGSNGLYFASDVDLTTGNATVDATAMLTNTEEAVVKAEVKDAEGNKDDLFTYITSKRFEVRDTQTIDVKVYSNCDSVELVVDGVSLGNGTVEQDCVFVWHDVELKQDETVKVEAIGTKDGEVVFTDTCDTWVYSATA